MHLKIQYLSSDFANQFSRLCEEYDQFYWASAWAGHPDLILNGKLKTLKHKFEKVIVGLDMGQTYPDFLRQFQDVIHVMPPLKGKIFHPKQFLFIKNDYAALFIGSANLTFKGLHVNEEAAVLIEGKTNETIIQDTLKQIQVWYSQGRPVTEQDIRFCATPKLQPDGKKQGAMTSLFEIKMLAIPEQVKAQRLEVLRESKKLLEAFKKDGNIDTSNLSKLFPHNTNHPDGDIHWSWFGTIRRFSNSSRLPLLKAFCEQDLTTREGFLKACQVFKGQTSEDKNWWAAISRICSLIEPSLYFPHNLKTINAITSHLKIPRNALNSPEAYWDKGLLPIKEQLESSPISLHSVVSHLWPYRAALMDAVFYEE